MSFYVFFRKFGPRGCVLECLVHGLELGSKSGKPKIRLPRSSEGFHARATTFVFRLSLERRNTGSSVNYKLSGFCVCRCTLERRDLRSSEELCLMLERASSGEFQQLVLFTFLQIARVREATLERPLSFGKLARAKESTLERDPSFQQVLKNIFKYIFAFSFHPRHS